MGWLTDWSYRKSITLSRASGAVSNYQMKLLVGESSGATGEDVDCAGHCLSNFNDLRFTASDGETLLDYWIESITGTTPNQLATVWIEFDSIGTGDTTFYMYYGNAGAAAYSSIADTFIVGDDFERGSNGDAIGGSWTLRRGDVDISTEQKYGGTRSAKFIGVDSSTSSTATISGVPVIDSTYAIRTRIYKEHAFGQCNFYHGNGTKIIAVMICAGSDIFYYDGSAHDTTKNINADAWNIIEFRNINFTAGTFDIYLNDTLAKSGATMLTNSDYNGTFLFENYHSASGNDVYLDDYIVRDWRSVEPAWGSWGAEFTEAEYYSVTVTPGPLFVTTSLSGTPWPELQKVTPGPLSVTASLSVSSVAASFVVTPAALAAIASLSCGNILCFVDTNYIISYVCYLTPSVASGLSRLTIPMSSFQGRFSSGDPSYLSVVTPGFSQSSDITNRVDEEDPPELSVYMVKTYADGNQISELIMVVDLEDVRIDQGAVNQSITLEGHRTNTYTAKSVTLSGASYKNLEDGSLRYRCSPDLYLRPGDTVTVNGDTFTANYISMAMSVDSQTMEVSEA